MERTEEEAMLRKPCGKDKSQQSARKDVFGPASERTELGSGSSPVPLRGNAARLMPEFQPFETLSRQPGT